MRKSTVVQKKKRIPITNILLRTAAVTGGISIALIAPHLLQILKKLDRPATNRAQLSRRITQGIIRLKSEGLVLTLGERGSRRVVLTEKGRSMLRQLEFGEYQIPTPAFWDGKWRVFMFDVAQKRRRTRDQLRRLLIGAGFVRLQDSVWVYPYACDEFVSLLRAHLKSGVGEMRYFVADALEADRALREHFNLL